MLTNKTMPWNYLKALNQLEPRNFRMNFSNVVSNTLNSELSIVKIAK